MNQKDIEYLLTKQEQQEYNLKELTIDGALCIAAAAVVALIAGFIVGWMA